MHINTEEIAKQLQTIESNLSSLNKSLSSYKFVADSFGESTFRPEIEAQLKSIITYYSENLVPIVQKMIEDITPVKTEYENRAAKLSAASTGQ